MQPINQAPPAAPPAAPRTVAGVIQKTILFGALTGGVSHLFAKIFKLSPIFTIVSTVHTVASTAFCETADLVGEKYDIQKHKITIVKSIATAVISAIGVAVLFGSHVISPTFAILSVTTGVLMLGVEIYAALNPKPPQSVAPAPA